MPKNFKASKASVSPRLQSAYKKYAFLYYDDSYLVFHHRDINK